MHSSQSDIFLCLIRDLLGNILMKGNIIDDFSTVFGKTLSFSQLYGFLKASKKFVFNKYTFHSLLISAKFGKMFSYAKQLTPKQYSIPVCSDIFSLLKACSYECPSEESLREKCPETELFLVRIFLYSVRRQEHTDQK